MSALPRTAPAWGNEVTWREHCDSADSLMRQAMARFYNIAPATPRPALHLVVPAVAPPAKVLKPRAKVDLLKVLHPLVVKSAAALGLTPFVLLSKRRTPELARARWAVMVALRGRGWSLPQIGWEMGKRDHTTVLHGLRRADALLEANADFAATVASVEAVL